MTAIAKKSAESHECVVTYDFAVHGGAVGTISLNHGLSKGCTVWGGYMTVITAPTSGGSATVAVQLEAANDVIAEAAISGAPWSTTGTKALVTVFTAATMKTTTVDRNVSVVIGTAALTAGKFEIHLLYSQNINTLS